MPVPKTRTKPHRKTDARQAPAQMSGLQRIGENPSLLDVLGIGVQSRDQGQVPEVRGDGDRAAATPEHRCSKCGDSGQLITTRPNGDRFVSDCECRAERRAERDLAAAGVPPKFAGASFASYRPSNPTQELALMKARGYAAQWPIDRSPSPAFVGPVGIGKTHLAVAIMREVASKGARCRFVNLDQLLRSLRATIGVEGASEYEILRPVVTADLVVFDEVGASEPSTYVREVLRHLIGVRYDENLPIIFTSNYRMRPAAGAVDPAASSAGWDTVRVQTARVTAEVGIADRIGMTNFDRLREMCDVFEMAGESQRGKR